MLLFWHWVTKGLLWTLHCARHYYYNVIMIWTVVVAQNVHRGTPSNAPATQCHDDCRSLIDELIGPWEIWMQFLKMEFLIFFLPIGIFRSSHDNALWWMPHDLTDDKSTLVQVMAWCRQATSHYLSQCWFSPLSPYGVARPQWVKYVCDFNMISCLFM